MNQNTTPRFDALSAAVTMTESLCRLPAVATLDWLDRAAAVLRGVVTPSRVCVLIARSEPNGSGLELEAAGFAGVAGLARSASPMADRTDEGSIELSIRSKAERLTDLGFAPPSHPYYGTLADKLGGGDWRTRGMGKLWQGIPASEVLLAVEPLGQTGAGRMLITHVALAEAGAEAKPGQLELLGAVHALLVRKALVAIGSDKATSSRWLTAREQEVLDLLVVGKSVRVIAEELGRSPHTVHDHVKSLHRKLGASSRGELVARALGHAQFAEVKPAPIAAPEIAEIRTTGAAQPSVSPASVQGSSQGGTQSAGQSGGQTTGQGMGQTAQRLPSSQAEGMPARRAAVKLDVSSGS